jgi:3-oxoacyl-[acyl-carrier protein] reductase
MELDGAVAIVTGGSGGLGGRICRALALAGTSVAVAYAIRAQVAEAVAGDLRPEGVEAEPFQCDVTDASQVEAMVDRVVERFGRIDVLINNAGYNKWIPFDDLDALTLQEWDKLITTNLKGPLICIKAVAPFMKRQGGGAIVNVSSVAGLRPSGSSIAYCVAKAGLNHLTRCMAVGLGPQVQVNCVAPGYMEGTRMSDNLSPAFKDSAVKGSALNRVADKDDVAEQVVAFCRTNSVTGQTLVMDCGGFFH